MCKFFITLDLHYLKFNRGTIWGIGMFSNYLWELVRGSTSQLGAESGPNSMVLPQYCPNR